MTWERTLTIYVDAPEDWLMEVLEDNVARIAFEAGLRIHKELGPGLFESVYEEILAHELRKQGLHVLRQVQVPLEWDGLRFEKAYRLDLLVEDAVIIEVKATPETHNVFKRQLLTYLKLMEKRLGLLINFGQALFKDGFARVANNMPA